ncbi:putative signal peptide protein [Puccinia sorghi]|uniref:Putative signal peptide protein n=1 Tax=Puccinia sorghi TaxID=27349 RepID=A0A0L6UCE5_9BASI|nr:putative signal peptide protein [Puccinia sorghi]
MSGLCFFFFFFFFHMHNHVLRYLINILCPP